MIIYFRLDLDDALVVEILMWRLQFKDVQALKLNFHFTVVSFVVGGIQSEVTAT